MIYDCFVFYDELDLLEIRLNTLSDVVDRFVLVESRKTYLDKDKELFYEKNKDRFEAFNSRIIHVVVDDFPKFNWKKLRKFRNWDREDYQRNSLMRGLQNLNEDDVIIFSDVDEIPNPEMVKKYAHTEGIKTFYHGLYYYYLNNMVIDHNEPNEFYKGYKPWHGSVMCSAKYYTKKTSPNDMRTYRNSPKNIKVMDGGWHYSFMGGTDMILKKLKSYSHLEYFKDGMISREWVEQQVNSGKDIFGRSVVFKKLPIGEGAPSWVVQNIDRYRHLFLG